MSELRGIPEKPPPLPKTFGKNFGVEGMEPRTSSLVLTWLCTRVWSIPFNANCLHCIKSVLVNVLTKVQGGAILQTEYTKLQELKKFEKESNRV